MASSLKIRIIVLEIRVSQNLTKLRKRTSLGIIGKTPRKKKTKTKTCTKLELNSVRTLARYTPTRQGLSSDCHSNLFTAFFLCTKCRKTPFEASRVVTWITKIDFRKISKVLTVTRRTLTHFIALEEHK